MLIIIIRATTKKMTKIHMVKQTTRELIQYTAQYLFNAKEDSNEGIEKEKDITYRKYTKY